MVSPAEMLLQLLLLFFWTSPCSSDHWSERQILLEEEHAQMLGSSLVLSQDEEAANAILMAHKLEEYDKSFQDPGIFSPGRHFFHAKEAIHQSEVFRFIQKMPKGAALHGHDTALVSEEYLYSLTELPNLYGCMVGERLRLKFMPGPEDDGTCDWILLDRLRRQSANFDSLLRRQLTLRILRPHEEYLEINEVWKELSDIFATVSPMITYKPVFEEHFYQALKELHDDNVMYMEFRGTLPDVYELDGTIYQNEQVASIYQEVIERFRRDHPDFLGARLIYAPMRDVQNATVEGYIQVVRRLQRAFPKLFAGFDLVGQEDLGYPLADFIEQIQKIPDIELYFHAAETNWYGTSSDFNLVDAILLGTKRIGHGFGLTKHPEVMEVVMERQIAIEVCPISNQVLMLVEDIRNHPAAILISQGYPVVISYDDPTFWSTKGLSYDFYMTFMGIASRNADLRLLKQLARNSLEFSSLPSDEKSAAITQWEEQWSRFIEEVIQGDGDDAAPDNGSMVVSFKLLVLLGICTVWCST